MVNEKVCPLCGEANNCDSESDFCWCYYIEVPKGLLEKIDSDNRGKACICENCIENYHKEDKDSKVRHIVMWDIVETYTLEEKIEISRIVKRKLEGLKDKINVILDIYVKRNLNYKDKDAKDLILTVDIKNMKDLEEYANNEEHLKVVSEIKKYLINRTIIDIRLN